MTAKILFALLYYAIGVLVGVWDMRQFFERLDARFPLSAPHQFDAGAVAIIALSAVMWPAVYPACWIASRFIDTPVGRRKRQDP